MRVSPMARTTIVVSVSLSPEEAEELDCAKKEEHRTRSGLIREALRQHIRTRPPVPEGSIIVPIFTGKNETLEQQSDVHPVDRHVEKS
jgi:metal-responsive CopG/Arc/MetJ family transcriptional regulator